VKHGLITLGMKPPSSEARDDYGKNYQELVN